jgi:hypothetical protein
MIFKTFSDIIYHSFDLIVAELEKRGVKPYESSISKGSRTVYCKTNNGGELIITDCTYVKDSNIVDFYGLLHYNCNGTKTFPIVFYVEKNEFDMDDFVNYLDNPNYVGMCKLL